MRKYNSEEGKVRGNYQYRLAITDNLEGVYGKYQVNPVADFSVLGNNKQFEVAYICFEDDRFKIIARSLGVLEMDYRDYLESKDGKTCKFPKVAYQPPAPDHLNRFDRAERPQLLFQNVKPTYLFTAFQIRNIKSPHHLSLK